MARTGQLAPLSACVNGYPSDAPQWGDELLDSHTTGLADEIRKHLVLALRSSRQPIIDGPESVKGYILRGEILPLSRKWRTYALDGRGRLDQQSWYGGMRSRSWVSRRCPTVEMLQDKLPLSDGGTYLIVYGGTSDVLSLSDKDGNNVASDLRAVRANLSVCDVIGWQMQGAKGIHWWSIAAGCGMDGTEVLTLDEMLIEQAGGHGWGEGVKPTKVARDTNTHSFSELIADWSATDPEWGDELADADESSLSEVALNVYRHIQLATRTSSELTIANPSEARERLHDRHIVPKKDSWSIYALDEQRRRVMVPSQWGQQAQRFVCDRLPDLEWLAEKLALPRGGRWLFVKEGWPRDLQPESAELEEILRDERVADVCSWRGGVFSSIRAQSVVEADGEIHDLKSHPGRRPGGEHHNSRKEG